MHAQTGPAAGPQRGSISVIALFFALVIGGLSIVMIEVGLASRRLQARGDSSTYALEAAETGTALAEVEVASQKDPGGDGTGTLSGTYGGLRYAVTATQDPNAANRYTLVAEGQHGQIRRRIETSVKLIPGSLWNFSFFARDLLTFGSSGAASDAYDSRKGSWASQAVNMDASGPYALAEGSIGSNHEIELKSKVTIRGDAMPGPGYTVDNSSGSVVTGSQAPMAEEQDVPDTPFAEFLQASLVNNNGQWTATGGLNYNKLQASLSVNKGNTLTLTGKTYFFRDLTLNGGSTIKVTNGPVKIYITDSLSLSGGTIVNTTASPFNLQFYQQPYPLPAGSVNKNNTATVSGGASAAFVLYAPDTDVKVTGNSSFFGAIIGRTIDVSGGAQMHFDVALRDQMPGGPNKVNRLYWRDLNPPLR